MKEWIVLAALLPRLQPHDVTLHYKTLDLEGSAFGCLLETGSLRDRLQHQHQLSIYSKL